MTTSTLKSKTGIEREIARADRYRVSVQEYITFRQQGFLAVRGLVAPEEIEELRQHTEDLMQGRLPQQQSRMAERDLSRDTGTTGQGLEAPPEQLSPVEKAQYFLRIHMLHRKLDLHERYMLHPRVLDVLEALIGPDILAMQTMLFLKPPGKPGQGWHQDSYYIPTSPDSLCGAWIAIDDGDELNGAMWFAAGSQVEPIYPPRTGYGHGDRELHDIRYVSGVSNPDDEQNDLAKVANKYPQLLVAARAGDVVFFGGHVLHRSKQNFSTDRFRRAFVSHYCSARSFTQWGADSSAPHDPHAALCVDPVTKMTNGSHILARGDSHLPFARPRFGTPCAALLSPEERRRQSEYAQAAMADMDSGMMSMEVADPNVEHDDEVAANGNGGY
ncbi:MAG: phytanoyl-CoA dioxygenase family protein [Armatimonadota bacterium]|nr:phytanoyl-CoA dioxygenase family protein [Armatimonadota bacterium]